MKDSATEIIKVFFELLDGNITYGGDTIPIYSVPPKNAKESYVLIEDPIQTDWGGHDHHGTEETITLQVVVREEVPGSKVKLHQLTNQIYNLVKPLPTTEIESDHFKSAALHLDNAFGSFEMTATDYAQRKIITYRYFLEEVIQRVTWDNNTITWDNNTTTWDS